MALCCINGVCVPYSALIPLLFYGLKWLLGKLTELGLIPKTWEERINSFVHKTIHSSSSSSSSQSTKSSSTTNGSSSCCDTTVGTCSTKSVEHTSGEVTTITTMKQWESLFTSSDSNNVIICKFTAKWCGPCKVIQPHYESLAKDNGTIKFVTIDVDNSSTESVGTLADVAILPTFVVFQSVSTNVVSTYIGSDQSKLLNLVQAASALVVETKKIQ